MGDLETKFGDLLKLERERRGKSLKDVSESLRIPEANLAAIEDGNVGGLPSPVYFNLFAKTYAESLGIDYTATMEAIREDIGEPPAPDTRKSKKSSAAEAPPKPAPKAAEVEQPPEISDEEPSEPAPEKKPRRRIWLAASIAAALVVVIGGYLLYTQVLSGSGIGSGLSGAEAAAKRNEELYAAYDWNVPKYQPGDSLRLNLIAHGESWATILADGDTIPYRHLIPGRTYPIAARYRFLVSLAVPDAIEIRLNGRPIDIVSKETGRISRFEINQANCDSLMNPTPAPGLAAPSTGDTGVRDDGRL